MTIEIIWIFEEDNHSYKKNSRIPRAGGKRESLGGWGKKKHDNQRLHGIRGHPKITSHVKGDKGGRDSNFCDIAFQK